MDEDRQLKCPQSETDVHRVPTLTIKPMRDDARPRMEPARISADALLRQKSADVQRDSGDDEERAKNPSKGPTHETRRPEPLERECREDRQDKSKRQCDRNNGAGI